MAGERCPLGEPVCGDQCALMKDGKTCLERLIDAIMAPKIGLAPPKEKK